MITPAYGHPSLKKRGELTKKVDKKGNKRALKCR